MLSKNQIHSLQSLRETATRKETRTFLVEGPKLVNELLESAIHVQCIYGLQEWISDNKTLINNKQLPYEVISVTELGKISTLTTPNQVLALAKVPPLSLNWNLLHQDLTLMLDGIMDPGNLGTIIRIADWFGIGQVICSTGSADAFNPKVVQASMGSVFRVSVFYENLHSFLSDVKDKIPVFGAFLDGIPVTDNAPGNKGILVIGSESHGISIDVAGLIQYRIKIPAFTSALYPKGAESLNASVAAGILCYLSRFSGNSTGPQC